jgi:CRP-like cAMP-binding protein
MKNKREWITETELLAKLPDAILDDMAAYFHPRVFPASTLVMMEDQISPSLCLIVKGTVKISLVRNGRETLLNIVGQGEVLGEISVIEEIGHSADILTLEETTLLWMERGQFASYLYAQPQLGVNLARIVSRRLRLATSRIEALANLDVAGRVAFQLLAFAKEYGQSTPDGAVTIPLCLTQSDLAALCGATRTRVNQALASMRRQKMIAILPNHYITLLNSDKLRRSFISPSSG